MALRMWLPVPNDPATDIYLKVEQEAPFLRGNVRRGMTVPGVEEIAAVDIAALFRWRMAHDLNPYVLVIEGARRRAGRLLCGRSMVTAEYFHLLRMPLLRGRLFRRRRR